MRVTLFIPLALPTIVSGYHAVHRHGGPNKSWSQLQAVLQQHHKPERAGNVNVDSYDLEKKCSRGEMREISALSVSLSAIVSTLAVSTPPALAMSSSTTLATAGPIPSAFFAWAHFLGILGISGGLFAERFLLKKQMTVEEEAKMSMADGIYGLAAISLLVSGYFRTTDFAKGWEFYQHEPLFWLKMASVAVLGGLSFFPTIVLFRRDLARRDGKELNSLSDALVDRMTTIINAELLALFTIPLLASLMARGVLYVEDFPWFIGAGLYAVSLIGAGFKYGKEAFDMMETEGALEETP